MRLVSSITQRLHDPRGVFGADVCTVTVRFQPLPAAPILKNRVFKVSASQKFETVINFLRKKLNCKPSDSVICYVNSTFAPGLDEGVGGLWRVSFSIVGIEIWFGPLTLLCSVSRRTTN